MITKALVLLLIAYLVNAKDVENVDCSGVGSDQSTALIDGIKKCKIIYSELISTSINYKSTVLETEKSTSFFSSAESARLVQNIKCNIQSQKCTEDNKIHKCELKCKFDGAIRDEPVLKDSSKVIKYDDIESSNLKHELNRKIESTTSLVFFSLIPKCDNYVIIGDMQRGDSCKQNPLPVSIKSTDKLIKFYNGNFKPVEVEINQTIIRNKNVQIIFKK